MGFSTDREFQVSHHNHYVVPVSCSSSHMHLHISSHLPEDFKFLYGIWHQTNLLDSLQAPHPLKLSLSLHDRIPCTVAHSLLAHPSKL